MPPPIVFDLDGVLVDTEPLKARAHRAAVEERGGELGLDLYRSRMGGPHDEVVRAFLAGSDLDTSEGAVARYEETFRAAYRDLLGTDLSPTEGAEALLAACREQDRRAALVTSSDRWMVEIVLPKLRGSEVFAAVVTADDVERTKPAPDPYLRAVRALRDGRVGSDVAGEGDADGSRADGERDGPGARGPVAVEDTASGVASARAAGLPVIAVRHRFNRRHDFDGAREVVDSLAPADAFLERVDRVAASYSGGGPTRP